MDQIALQGVEVYRPVEGVHGIVSTVKVLVMLGLVYEGPERVRIEGLFQFQLRHGI